MIFVNPLKLLEDKTLDLKGYSEADLRKANKRVLADFNLNDGQIDVAGRKITRSNYEQLYSLLEDQDHNRYCLYLSKNEDLSNFLATGDAKFLYSFSDQTSIFSEHKFINFIAPYFLAQYSQLFLDAFRDDDTERIKRLVHMVALIQPSDQTRAFGKTDSCLQQANFEVEALTSSIKSGQSQFTDTTVKEVVKHVKDLYPSIATLEKLPAYFSSSLNSAVEAINYLQLATWNEFNDTGTPCSLLQIASEIPASAALKETISSNYGIVKKKHDQRLDQERNAPHLKRWLEALVQLMALIKKSSDSSVDPANIVSSAHVLLDLKILNGLGGFADEIRTQLAFGLRSLSIELWNGRQAIYEAIQIIDLALRIELKREDKGKLIEDKEKLTKLEKDNRGIFICYFCEKNKPVESAAITKTMYSQGNRYGGQVHFQYVDAIIPRCQACASKHATNVSSYSGFIPIVFAAMGVLIGIAVDDEIGWFLGIVGGYFLGKILGALFNHSTVESEGIKPNTSTVLLKHPLIKERADRGWSFNKPKA